jgi:hypothetical protein
MLLVCVYTFILQKAKEMKAALISDPTGNKVFPPFCFKQLTRSQTFIDAFEFLDDDPTGTHVKVSDFGRTLITVRKTHRFAGALKERPRIGFLIKVYIGGFGCEYGVTFFYFAVTPAVANYQAHRSHGFALFRSIRVLLLAGHII